MRTSVLVLFTLLSACQEYNLSDGLEVSGHANPPPLESPSRADHIVQVPNASVDVLWVVDNSCSMSEEQDGIAANAPVFMNYFIDSDMDWHVGVVSTDMYDSGQSARLQSAGGYAYIDAQTPNPVAKFGSMMTLGTSGSSTEQGRRAAYHAIETLGDTQNTGFYRDDASLAVVVISDEEDQSNNNPSLNEFISWISNLKPDLDLVSFSSIVCMTENKINGQYCGGGMMTLGSEYLAVTNAVGGVKWEIRDTRWDTVLSELGIQALGLKREFFLADIPVPESIEVTVLEPAELGGDVFHFELGTDFEYSATRNSIRFTAYVPPQLSEVVIDYDLLAAQFQQADTGSGY